MNSVCPKGHVSTDPDYCSECGAPMQARKSAVSAAPTVHAAETTSAAPTTPSSEHCPDCMTPRPAGARYCELCRYDFLTRTSFSGLAASAAAAPVATPASAALAAAPMASAPSQPAPDASPAAAAERTLPAGTRAPAALDGAVALAPAVDGGPAPRLKLRIVVDASLYKEPVPDAACPVDAPEKVFHLDLDENTLGRQYEGKGVYPEIVVHDPGISRRHLKFVRNAAGGFSVLELGSSNGTAFNEAPLEPGIETPVRPGDQLTLGMWTRIYVDAR